MKTLLVRASYKKKLNQFLWVSTLILLGISTVTFAAEEPDWRYSMVKGDNPWTITERYLDGIVYWKRLVKLNQIKRPRHLPPGTELSIPFEWLKIEPSITQVVDISGDASYIAKGSSTATPLTKGDHLRAGDKAITGANGTVVLKYTDGSILILGKESQVTLSRVNKFSTTGLADSEVKLESGRTENKVKTKGTRFEIKTPSASTAVRGTSFRVGVDQSNAELSTVEVLGGVVGVTGGKKTLAVPAGFGTSIQVGQAPLPPVKLLPSPEVIAPEVFSRKLPVDFQWRLMGGAKAYRLQVAASENPNVSIIDQVVANTRFSTLEVPDGHFILKLRAIDPQGLEGAEVQYKFELDARPQPPLAVAPQIDEVVRSKVPEFEWSSPAEGGVFQLQISATKDFSTLLLDKTELDDVTFSPDSWKPGAYYWRMATKRSGEVGPFSDPSAFVLRPSPEPPEISDESDEQKFSLRWSKAKPGQSFKVQIGADPLFKTLITEETIGEARWQMDRPENRVYFRVRTIDVDGFEGAWGVVYQIDPPPTPWYILGIPIGILLFAL